ncbi:MAG TPA: hypothetical protein VF017_12645 [Thermoanaerobaculia bacterium]|nr:hypothetical protein [Thermoanaerobaculia bacterium]
MTACLLHQGFRLWPGRSKRITVAKLRRKLASVESSEAAAFFDCSVFLHAEQVSLGLLRRRYPQGMIARFLDLEETDSGDLGDSWPLISITWFRGPAGGHFNPANSKLLLGLRNEHFLSDESLPDPRALFPDLPRTPGKKSLPPPVVTELRFRPGGDSAEFVQSVHAHAPTLEKLVLETAEPLQEPGIAEVSLPSLRELSLGSLEPLRDPLLGPWLAKLPALRVLRSALPPRAAGIPLAMKAASWWRRLTSLELQVHQLEAEAEWQSLWSGERLALEDLDVRWLSRAQAATVLRAPMPDLRVLDLQGSLGAGYLDDLTHNALPNLEELDLRGAAIQPEDFQRVAPVLAEVFPKLRRVGIRFMSDRRVDFFDWTGGPPVHWAYEPMSDQELQEGFLDALGLELLKSEPRG